MKTLWTGADIYLPSGKFARGHLLVSEDGRIEAAGKQIGHQPEEVNIHEAEGLIIVPGFIDVHVHGGNGCNVMDAKYESLNEMSRFHAARGTTSFLATTNTSNQEHLISALACAADAITKGVEGAEMLGIHLEGPFISLKRRGAQLADDVRLPTPGQIDELIQASGHMIKLVTLAPELDGGMEAVTQFRSHGITVSAGHSDATFQQIKEAVTRGVTHTTHHFNGMSPLHHRDPGLAGAGLMLPELTIELIADGHHVHPAVVRMMYDLKKALQICAVTDAVTSCGLPDGDYGYKEMREGQVYLKGTNTLAGSSLTMIDALRNIMSFTGLSLEEVLPSFTTVPARQVGIDFRKGSLEAGKDADFLVLDSGLNVMSTWVKGRKVFDRLS
ncbi:N-acetylglucosamine-6-phosphate deacetylase [Paenibacillus lemnae]|uniref:N-acetylglucosamine-6-phosphate deacetylase n=1 Tax=Paenibacillus lemnae TaxID=1330551 RepID=A0A848M3G9_PAELE|nr:N-acetylglucosamine-6-phosphate deacetylase [Paenibacillus lemnae]NMO95568.1 N-acetylglucosamine-6-phosphate deacetylase [Paenibacillus lemnae]